MFTAEVVDWLFGASFQRMPGLPQLIGYHLVLAFVPMAIAIAIAVPAGVWVGHTGRGGTLAVNLANVGRAVPSLGILLLAVTAVGRGYLPVVVALVAMAIPPMVTNSYIGVREVDADVRDAARGMGLTGWHLVRQVEVPIALPVIMAGVRTSAVQVVATATLAGYPGLDSLGLPIFVGLATGVQFNAQARAIVLIAVLAVALLAVLTEQGLGWLEQRIVPTGILAREAARAGAPPPDAMSDPKAASSQPAEPARESSGV